MHDGGAGHCGCLKTAHQLLLLCHNSCCYSSNELMWDYICLFVKLSSVLDGICMWYVMLRMAKPSGSILIDSCTTKSPCRAGLNHACCTSKPFKLPRLPLPALVPPTYFLSCHEGIAVAVNPKVGPVFAVLSVY
jgi:hypothetical protein